MKMILYPIVLISPPSVSGSCDDAKVVLRTGVLWIRREVVCHMMGM